MYWAASDQIDKKQGDDEDEVPSKRSEETNLRINLYIYSRFAVAKLLITILYYTIYLVCNYHY